MGLCGDSCLCRLKTWFRSMLLESEVFEPRTILFTRARDLMVAHGPRPGETLWEFSENLAIWTSRRENRKLENFALTKAGEDRNFRLKTEQKSIIEDVVCLFVFYTIARTLTLQKNSLQIFVGRTSSQSGVTSTSPICFNFSARFFFIPCFPKIFIASLQAWRQETQQRRTLNSTLHGFFFGVSVSLNSI